MSKKVASSLNNNPSLKGYLFIEAKELESVYKTSYSVLFVLGITASYTFLFLQNIYLSAPVLLALALGWVLMGQIIQRYVLQDRLISKGDIGGFV